MALFKKISGDGWQLALWKIEESVEELLSLVQLNAAQLDALMKLTRQNRQKEKLISQYLVSHLTNSNAEILYKSNGAPYILHSGFNLSITHTKGWVAVQVDSKRLPGIDIEYRSDRILKVAHKFIAESESHFISESEKLSYYNVIWCAKEALYKIAQIEGLIFTDDLLVEPFDLQEEGDIKGLVRLNSSFVGIDLHYVCNSEWYLVYRT